MKTITRITAVVLSAAILIPSVLLWTNLSFIKTAAFSVLSAVTSGEQRLDKGLSAAAGEIDGAAADYIGFHSAFIDLYGLGMRLCGSRLVHAGSRTVLKLDSGAICEYETDRDYPAKSAQIARDHAAALIKLKQNLDRQGIPFLFVLAPGKISETDPGLPYRLPNYVNKNADSFLNELNKAGVDTLDLRAYWREKGWSRADGFFYSDLHWRPKYALLSWAHVTQVLNDRYGIRNDPALFDLKNQKVETYDNVSLGSTGRIVGRFYAKTDSTELYIPNYETSFHLVNKRVGWDKTGTCEETTVDRSFLHKGGVYDNDLISMYYARDSVIENKMAPNDANVVFIRDSFGGMLGGYVPLAFRNTSIVDLRTMNERKGETVSTIIHDFNTDLVIVFYHVGMITNETMFEF